MKCGISLSESIAEVVRGQTELLGAAAVKKLTSFHDFFVGLTEASQKESLADLYQRVVHDSGYLAELKAEGTEEAKGRIENLEEFYNVVQTFDEEAELRELGPEDGLLANFLNQITLESQALEAAEASGGTISLMTLHSSKGLEFPVVILVGCEEGIFPSKRALEESEWEDSAIEEERRLCYVGMTRAMRYLTMTHVSVRRIYGQVQVAAPSRFLGEIPDRLKRVEGKSHMAPTVSWSSVGGKDGRSRERHYDFADSEPAPVEIAPSYGNNGGALEVGRKVNHEVYGKGTIRAIDGAEADRKVTIEFSGYQKKKFLVRHVKLELL
jgi:DNA helicase-2/ATP-dependent DNA helicase PcrA